MNGEKKIAKVIVDSCSKVGICYVSKNYDIKKDAEKLGEIYQEWLSECNEVECILGRHNIKTEVKRTIEDIFTKLHESGHELIKLAQIIQVEK